MEEQGTKTGTKVKTTNNDDNKAATPMSGDNKVKSSNMDSNNYNKNRNPQNEQAHVRQLEDVFGKANKTGEVLKKMLSPAVCRSEAMKLWRQVLNANIYNNIR